MKYHRHSIFKKHIITNVRACNLSIKGGCFKAIYQEFVGIDYFFGRNERRRACEMRHFFTKQ